MQLLLLFFQPSFYKMYFFWNNKSLVFTKCIFFGIIKETLFKNDEK